jgi:hypothetical protein
MSADRLSEFWLQTESPDLGSQPFTTEAMSAFVLCPTALFQFMNPWQHAQTACIYRLAYEQAQAEVRRPQVLRIPAFSAN